MKPPVIQRLEKQWGRERTHRQGEVFVYKLTFGWRELFRAWWKTALWFGYYFRENILRTRHLHTGWGSVIDLQKIGATSYRSEAFVVDGTISARGHSPLHLKGPHVVAHAALHVKYD